MYKYDYKYNSDFDLLEKVVGEDIAIDVISNYHYVSPSSTSQFNETRSSDYYYDKDTNSLKVKYECKQLSDINSIINISIYYDDNYNITKITKEGKSFDKNNCSEKSEVICENISNEKFDISIFTYNIYELNLDYFKFIPQSDQSTFYTIRINVKNKKRSDNEIIDQVLKILQDKLPSNRRTAINQIDKLLRINSSVPKIDKSYEIIYDETSEISTKKILTKKDFTSYDDLSFIEFKICSSEKRILASIILDNARYDFNKINTDICQIVTEKHTKSSDHKLDMFYNTDILEIEGAFEYIVKERILAIDYTNTTVLKTLQLTECTISSDDLYDIIEKIHNKSKSSAKRKNSSLDIISGVDNTRNKFSIVNIEHLDKVENNNNIYYKSIVGKTEKGSTDIIMTLDKTYSKAQSDHIKIPEKNKVNVSLFGLLGFYGNDVPDGYEIDKLTYQDTGEFQKYYQFNNMPLPGTKKYYYSENAVLIEYTVTFPRSGKRLQKTEKYYVLCINNSGNEEEYGMILNRINYKPSYYYFKQEHKNGKLVYKEYSSDNNEIDCVVEKISKYKELFNI